MFLNKKMFLYAVGFILIVSGGVIYKLFMNGSLPDGTDGIVITSSAEKTSEETAETTAFSNISVYICGEVNAPGVYELPRGSILNDAVKLAGGLTDNAAAEHIDLVFILDKNISVRIPSLEEIAPDSNFVVSAEEFQTAKSSDGKDNLININTASKEDLMTLPGIGGATAESIIEYRKERRFERIEDLMNVSGIGEAKFNKIKDLICC